MELTDTQVKVLISVYVLSEGGPANNVVRRILFGSGNEIDWQKAWVSAKTWMPELQNDVTVRNILQQFGAL